MGTGKEIEQQKKFCKIKYFFNTKKPLIMQQLPLMKYLG